MGRGPVEPCGCSPASVGEPRGAPLETSSRRTEMKLPVNSPGPLGAGLTPVARLRWLFMEGREAVKNPEFPAFT